MLWFSCIKLVRANKDLLYNLHKGKNIFPPMQDTGALCCQFAEYHRLFFFFPVPMKLLLNCYYRVTIMLRNRSANVKISGLLFLSSSYRLHQEINVPYKDLSNFSALYKQFSIIACKHNAQQIKHLNLRSGILLCVLRFVCSLKKVGGGTWVWNHSKNR